MSVPNPHTKLVCNLDEVKSFSHSLPKNIQYLPCYCDNDGSLKPMTKWDMALSHEDLQLVKSTDGHGRFNTAPSGWAAILGDDMIGLDIDMHHNLWQNHSHPFKFLQSHLAPSLAVKTPSGGLHIYYLNGPKCGPQANIASQIIFKDPLIQTEWLRIINKLPKSDQGLSISEIDVRQGRGLLFLPGSVRPKGPYKVGKAIPIAPWPSGIDIKKEGRQESSDPYASMSVSEMEEQGVQAPRNEWVKHYTKKLVLESIPFNDFVVHGLLAMQPDKSDGGVSLDEARSLYDRYKEKHDKRMSFIEQYVCVTSNGAHKFVNLRSGSEMSGNAFKSQYGPKAETEFREQEGKYVEKKIWSPSEAMYVTHLGATCYNSYKRLDIIPRHTDEDIDIASNGKPYMNIIRQIGRRLCTSSRAEEEFHQMEMHKAYTLQHVEQKIQWHLFLPGSPRTGKNLYFKDVCSVLGTLSSTVDAQSISSGWGDYFAAKKVLIIDEINEGFNRKFYDYLKGLLVSGSSTYKPYNMKGKGIMECADVSSIYMMSNNNDAITVDRDGDKIFIIESFGLGKLLDQPDMSPELISELVKWIEGVGVPRIYGYYLDVDTSSFTQGKIPFVTDGVHKMVVASASSLASRIQEEIDNPSDVKHNPFHNDAVKSKDVHAYLNEDESYKKSSEKAIRSELGQLGAINLIGQKRNGEHGTSCAMWVIRNHENWVKLGKREMYEKFYSQNKAEEDLIS